MVSTLDFESSDPSSNLGGTYSLKIYYICRTLSFVRGQHLENLDCPHMILDSSLPIS